LILNKSYNTCHLVVPNKTVKRRIFQRNMGEVLIEKMSEISRSLVFYSGILLWWGNMCSFTCYYLSRTCVSKSFQLKRCFRWRIIYTFSKQFSFWNVLFNNK